MPFYSLLEMGSETILQHQHFFMGITILAVILNLNPGNNFYFFNLRDDHEAVGQNKSSEILIYIT